MHVTDAGLAGTEDADILTWTARERRVIATADTDFGALLAMRGAGAPSVILLRSSDHLTPDEQAVLLLAALEHVSGDLESGAVASVSPTRIRLRTLPIEHS